MATTNRKRCPNSGTAHTPADLINRHEDRGTMRYHALTTEGDHIHELIITRRSSVLHSEERTGRRWPATAIGKAEAKAHIREANLRLWREEYIAEVLRSAP